jgi:hypothetical protein
MINLVKLNTANDTVVQYPYNRLDLQSDHPNTSFPNSFNSMDLSSFNAAIVSGVAAPSGDQSQTLVENNPTLVNTTWTQSWSLVAATSEEEEANLEAHRSYKYAEIDTDLQTSLDAGFTTSYGWKLGLDIDSLRELTAQFLEAKELDADGSTANISVVDTTYTSNSLSYGDFRTLVLSYLSARQAIIAADTARRKIVYDATTYTQIDNA